MVFIYGIPAAFRDGVHLFIFTAVRHWGSPKFSGSRNGVPMTFTAESPSVTGPVKLKIVPNGGCLGRSPWTNEYTPLFPTPTIVVK